LRPFDQGFYINGAISAFGFNASATIDIDPNKGIAVEGQMDKIVIVTETLFSIRAAEGAGGPRVSVATFTQPNQTDEQLRPPHIYINGLVQILGLSRAVYVRLTTKGFEFDLNGWLIPLVYLDAHGSIGGPSYLKVGGAVQVGIDTINLGPLGKISLDSYAQGALDIQVAESGASASVEAHFRFAGQGFDLPKQELDITTEALKELPETLYKAIKDFLWQLLQDAAKWAEYVAKGLIKGVEDSVKVLQEYFHKSLEEARKVWDEAVRIAAIATQICSVTTAALQL
jgi:hypothetical protein